MDKDEIWLADPSGQFCDRLTLLEKRSAFYVGYDVRHPNHLTTLGRDSGKGPALVLVTARSLANRNDAEFADLTSVCGYFIGIPIVVLCDNVSIRELASAMIAGARGFLSRNISLEGLRHSLSLVLAGETVLPGQIGGILSEPRAQQKHPPTRLSDRLSRGVTVNEGRLRSISSPGFGCAPPSPREIEVLECLANGDTNKVIAGRLQIAESTVKVHVKSVLRKVQVQNRTSAAIWAIENGYKRDAE